MKKFQLPNSNFKSIFNNLMLKIKNLPKSARFRGFTLIEIIIYMGLLAMILLVVVNLMITSSSFSQEENARLEIQQNARFATERIIRDLQSNQAISTPNNSTPTNNLIIASGPQQIAYSLNNNRVIRTDTTSVENTTNNQVKIDFLEFKRIENTGGKPTIKITMRVNYVGNIQGNIDISQEFSTIYSIK